MARRKVVAPSRGWEVGNVMKVHSFPRKSMRFHVCDMKPHGFQAKCFFFFIISPWYCWYALPKIEP